MYSWDQASAEDHVADWIANGDYCLTTDFTGGINTNGWDPGTVHFKLNYGTVNVGLFAGLAADVVGTTVVEPNAWSHIALTISETEVALYLNGELEASATLDAPVTCTLGNAFIGGWANPWSGQTEREMTGLVDDVLIYDRALSAGEIRYLASR